MPCRQQSTLLLILRNKVLCKVCYRELCTDITFFSIKNLQCKGKYSTFAKYFVRDTRAFSSVGQSNRLIIWRSLVQAQDGPPKRIVFNGSLFFVFGLLPRLLTSFLTFAPAEADSKQRSQWVSARQVSSPRWPTERKMLRCLFQASQHFTFLLIRLLLSFLCHIIDV